MLRLRRRTASLLIRYVLVFTYYRMLELSFPLVRCFIVVADRLAGSSTHGIRMWGRIVRRFGLDIMFVCLLR